MSFHNSSGSKEAKLLQALKAAEERAKKAEEEKKEAEEEKKEADRRLQKTTWSEYLMICHEQFASKLVVQTDISQTTTGFTNADGRRYPNTLRPWTRFLSHREKVIRRLLKVYPMDSSSPKAFPNLENVMGSSGDLEGKKIGSESAIARYLDTAVNTPVARIIDHMKTIPAAQARFNLGYGITFDENRNILKDDANDGIVAQFQHQNISDELSSPEYKSSSAGSSEMISAKPAPTTGKSAAVPMVDQMCVYVDNQGESSSRIAAFIMEYKPPHKLSRADLEEGLQAPMNIRDEILGRAQILSEEEEEAKYYSKVLVAKTMTQTYDYMIKMGLEYSFVTTGEAFVFLHIRKDDPTTLYYHLAEPDLDFDQHKNHPDAERILPLLTPVGQALTFSLLALGSKPRNQRWRKESLDRLDIWSFKDDDILSNMPESVKKARKTRKARRSSSYRSAALPDLSLPVRITRSHSCHPGAVAGQHSNPSPSPESSDADIRPPTTPVPTSRARGRGSRSFRRARRARRAGRAGRSNRGGQNRPYCTQECLLGLARGTALDQRCPNVSFHRNKKNNDGNHPIDSTTLLSLLRKQLGEDLDDYCHDLGIRGARGALFQVTLREYGYTMAAKGTVAASVHHLRHELRVYQRLRALQGEFVPVCLGNVDLIHPYYYAPDTEIVHMLFLAWAGTPLKTDGVDRRDVRRTLERIQSAGVRHNDVRSPNLLWSKETGGVMLIDFERSTIFPLHRSSLSSTLSSRKRNSKGLVIEGAELVSIKRGTDRSWQFPV
ncbi:MAG: hypothetical protein M1814_006520 [Vezdaea aestivalis]|nr:MAG: hypothetical protein M1814_006520 [Vezdaea aestivalis]